MGRLKSIFMTIAATVTTMSAMAQTDGFSYQAVIRNSKGELVKKQNVGLQLTIADSAATNVMYKEIQTVPTNDFGVLSVTVGRGAAQNGTKLSNVDWTKPAWLHIAIDVNGGTDYIDFGASKIQAVPVALYAARSGNGAQTVGITGSDDTLFEVKDKDGNVVFAVYPDGVRVYIDENANKAARRSGFLVTGRSGTKNGEGQDYFVINADGTQVFVDDDSKAARRSGFLVTGRSATKEGMTNNLFSVNDEGTKVFIDNELDDNKAARRSGFLVTGRSATKNDGSDYLKVATNGTILNFDESSDKAARRSGVLVTGRSGRKDGAVDEYMTINADGTKVFVDDDESKAARRSGFLVTGRSATKDGETSNFLSVNDEGTKVFIDNELDDNKAARRSGFLVTGRSATKGDNSYLKVATDGTLLSFDESTNKAARRSGVLVTGRSGRKDATEKAYMTVNPDSTRFYIDDFNIDLRKDAITINNESQLSWYPAKNIFKNGDIESSTASFFGSGSPTNNDSLGVGSFRAGYQCIASGDYSQAMGYMSRAEGNMSFAVGHYAYAAGSVSFAFGKKTTAKGESSYAIGHMSSAEGHYSFALGEKLTAYSKNETVIGVRNTEYAPIGTELNSWNPSDRLFVIGNGETGNSDALIVYKSGDMTVNGTITHSGLVGPSDIRLKKDVQQLDGALDKVLQLRGVSFYWKNKEEMAVAKGKDVNNMSYGFDSEKQIGVIAQEIEEVLPELVVTDKDGFKAVKYENLTPLLIEAIKDQQTIIDGQNKKIEDLEAVNNKLQSQIDEILRRLDQ
ncbi:MAG: tail fiber domain-containing protein [Salinivirgaceae bacterium]|nr:tail fiber domain-containing protein [Salinivirgaceae bacterium]